MSVPIDPRISPKMLREEANRREVGLSSSEEAEARLVGWSSQPTLDEPGNPTAPEGRGSEGRSEGRSEHLFSLGPKLLKISGTQDPETEHLEVISGADFSRHEKTRDESRRILLVGVPRSGTTWVGSALSATKRTLFVDEPDDERRWPQAMYAKRHLSRYPIISPGDRDLVGGYSIADYVKLWENAFSLGHPFAPSNLIIKSTFVVFCLEWLVEMLKPDAVCWVMRHPMNTLASWMEYKHELHPEEDTAMACKRMGWQYAMWLTEFDRCEANGIINYVVWHEDLSADFSNFELLAKDLGLEWNYRSTDWLTDMNRQGDGGHPGLSTYKRDDHVTRVAGEQTKERWRERLSEQEQALFLHELARWPAVAKHLDEC